MFAFIHVKRLHFGHIRTKTVCWIGGIGASSTSFSENTVYLPSCIKELFTQRTTTKKNLKKKYKHT